MTHCPKEKNVNRCHWQQSRYLLRPEPAPADFRPQVLDLLYGANQSSAIFWLKMSLKINSGGIIFIGKFKWSYFHQVCFSVI